MKTELGNTYVDVITGFRGVSIGRVEYLTGCNQVLLAPRTTDTAVKPSAEWIDEQRLELMDVEKITIDNGMNPGCDKQAPIR